MRFLITIVGMRFRERYENHMYLLKEDLERARGFKLEFESENKYDDHAIKALMNLDGENYHFGYVSREFNRNSDLRNMIEKGAATVELSRSGSSISAIKLRVY